MTRLLALALAFAASAAEAQGLQERLRALAAPPPVTGDLYAEDKADDLARIEADADDLFPDGEAIALFTGPDCPDCAKAASELSDIASKLGVEVNRLHIGSPEAAALMARMTLDVVPSYVMPDRLIRGHMPAFVLERYLAGQ